MRITNPRKLVLSKWTAVKPKNKERHFIVTQLVYSEQQAIIACLIEAVITRHTYQIDWQDLNDRSCWHVGWK